MNRIAVFLKENAVCPFYKSDGFTVYEKTNGQWKIQRVDRFDGLDLFSPRQLRSKLLELPSLIADCKILAGGELAGLAFSVFDRAGLHIFAIDSVSDSVLDGILCDVEEADAALAAEDGGDIGPQETDKKGVYFLDLVKLQEAFPDISSKKALMGFFESAAFVQLKLICRHLPPWIEKSGKYFIQTHPQGEYVFAEISPKTTKR